MTKVTKQNSSKEAFMFGSHGIFPSKIFPSAILHITQCTEQPNKECDFGKRKPRKDRTTEIIALRTVC